MIHNIRARPRVSEKHVNQIHIPDSDFCQAEVKSKYVPSIIEVFPNSKAHDCQTHISMADV